MSIFSSLVVVTLNVFFAVQTHPQVIQPQTLPATQRIYLAAEIYNALQAYFAGWTPDLRATFEVEYRKYLAEVLRTDKRRDFDLASIRLLASLHNGHTGFRDSWLDDSEGSPLGFNARNLDGKWTVTTSQLPGISPGDVVETVNARPVLQFFEEAQPYLADSSRRAQETDLFSESFLFPREFTVRVSGNRSIAVNRSKPLPASEGDDGVSGRWLQDQSVAYIRIPAFDGVKYQAKALGLVETFKNASTLIIDLRGNPGGRGDPPRDLQMALIDKPYRSWIESSPTMTGRLSTLGYLQASASSGQSWIHPEARPEGGIYRGRLILLIDRGCASYCEDFLMPFKTSGRGSLVGETTAGTYAQTYWLNLGDGMSALIAATAEYFPDGTKFEGIGIAPDFPLAATLEDIRNGKDTVMEKAREIAASR